MMNITAADVNKLRQQTGAGLMDCKKALVESKGNFEEAIIFLRKKGQKLSDLRSDREAREGVVIAKSSDDNKVGIAITLNCETDFVAKNQDFIAFAERLCDFALGSNVSSLDDLMSRQLDGVSVKDKVAEQIVKIGEKLEISKFERIEGEMVVPYIHAGYRLGVLVGLNKTGNHGLSDAARNIAMQIAAMNPIAIDKEDVPPEIVEREMEIGKEQARNEGKPDHMLDQIAKGKVQKFFKEHTLINQTFVKDSSKTVGQMLSEVDKEAKVQDFRRVSLS